MNWAAVPNWDRARGCRCYAAARPGRKALQTLPEFEQIVERIVVS